MSDLKLYYIDGSCDINIKNNDIETEEGLRTAIIISLFTDRRVSYEELPAGQTDCKGYWGDALNSDGDLTGSKLWLLNREKITTENLNKAKEYCEEALHWLVDDGIAEKIIVTVSRLDLLSVKIYIEIFKKKSKISQKYDFIWRNT